LLTVYFLQDFFGNVCRKLRLQGLSKRRRRGNFCRMVSAGPRLISTSPERLRHFYSIFYLGRFVTNSLFSI